ncbi:MAG TPA: serine/threonine-protein kinase, partial [Anaeromyxobacteraceae bacterium]|nr:serine/threonine-protein kinase [Anaeromyxobacteraceae bacterium]
MRGLAVAEERGLKPGATRDAAGAAEPGTVSRLLLEIAQASEEEAAQSWREALKPGDAIGRYQIRREIGRGGFGAVYEAFDPELGRTVALKALKPGRTRRLFSEEWIRKEAEAVAKLDHPAIVTIHDVGTCPAGAYLVMELLHGGTLADRIAAGPLSIDDALRMAEQLAEGLAHAHQRGLLHRDLKPANVFVCEDGRVKLLDFGLAHLLGTEVSSGAGTPAFMAPEQVAGTAIDERADVFALGTVLFQLLTGRLPYDPAGARGVPSGGTAPAVPRAPAALGRLLDRMLARDPAERLASAEEAREALAALRRSREPRKKAWAAWTLAAVALGLAVTFAVKPPKLPPGRLRVAVADLDNRTGDPSLDGVGELFREALEQSRRVALLPRSSLLGALQDAEPSSPKVIGEAQVMGAARKLGGHLALVPSIRSAGNGFELGVSGVNVLRSEAVFGLREQVAAAASVYSAIDRLVVRVRKALAEEPDEAPSSPVSAVAMAPANAHALGLYAEGKRLQSESDFDAAKDLFRASAEADPEFPLPRLEILQSVVGVYMTPMRMTDEERAGHVAALRRNLHRLPAGDRAFAEFAIITTEGGYQDGTELLAAIDRLIEARPEDPRPYILAANELVFDRGDLEAARPYVDRAFALSPTAGLGDVIDHVILEGRLDDALSRTRRWVEEAPGFTSHLNLAMVLHAMGRTEEAIAVLRDGRVPAFEARMLLLDAGLPDEPEAELLKRGPLPLQWLALRGRVSEGLARQEASLAGMAERGVPVPAGMRVARVFLLLPRGDTEGIRREVQEAFRARGSEPFDAWLLAEAGVLDLSARVDGGRFPNHRLDHRMAHAIRTWKRGDREKALDAFRSIGAPSSHLHQGEILLELGRDREAEEEIRRYRCTFGASSSMRDDRLTWWNYPRALHVHAVALERIGDVEGARSVNDQLLRLWDRADPDLPLLVEARAMQARLALGG